MTVFAIAYIDHDGDHIEYVCGEGVTVTRAWQLCDQLNETQEKHERLELILVEVLR